MEGTETTEIAAVVTIEMDGQAGGLDLGPADVTERKSTALKHDQIAQDIWEDYQGILLGVVLLLNIHSFLCLVISHTMYDEQECHSIIVFLQTLQNYSEAKDKTKYLCVGSQVLPSWSITHAFLNPLQLSSM
jgi:hypothetical protein